MFKWLKKFFSKEHEVGVVGTGNIHYLNTVTGKISGTVETEWSDLDILSQKHGYSKEFFETLENNAPGKSEGGQVLLSNGSKVEFKRPELGFGLKGSEPQHVYYDAEQDMIMLTTWNAFMQKSFDASVPEKFVYLGPL